MGYESKLYIVEEYDFKIPSDDGKVWARVIGTIDLCVCHAITKVFTEVANGYIYADDGDTRIEKDRYDAPLSVAKLDDVIKCLNKIYKEEGYDRAKIASDFLKSIKKYRPDCVVYHYGH